MEGYYNLFRDKFYEIVNFGTSENSSFKLYESDNQFYKYIFKKNISLKDDSEEFISFVSVFYSKLYRSSFVPLHNPSLTTFNILKIKNSQKKRKLFTKRRNLLYMQYAISRLIF